MPETASDRQIVTALARGLALLSCFRVNRPLLTNGELAESCELPRSSVSRLTHTLVKLGYLEYDSTHRAYRLGPKVLSISYAMWRGMTLRPIMLPHMKKLAAHSQSLVALATCEDNSMLIVDAVEGPGTLAEPLEVGSHVGLIGSAMGRAYLCGCSPAERLKILQNLARRRKRNPAELQEIASRAEAEFRKHGYCTSIHEWRDGVTGLAIPLRLENFGRTMVLTCGGSARQLSPEKIEEIAPVLISTAQQIEQQCRKLRHY